MSRIRENLRVVVIGENNEIRKGTVKSVCPEIRVALVKMDDGNMEKVPYDCIGVDESRNENVSTEPEKVQEEKTELQDGAKVITKDQFIDAVHHVTSPEGMLGDKANEVDPMNLIIKGMTCMCVGMTITEKLFQDKEEIEITRDQLKEVIKKYIMPSEISKSVGGKIPERECFSISLLSGLVLLELIHYFFDDSKND